MKIYFAIVAITFVCCLLGSVSEGCYMMLGSCENNGVQMANDSSWLDIRTCSKCNCVHNKRLLKTCKVKGELDVSTQQEVVVGYNIAIHVQENRMLRCRSITEERAGKLPVNRVLRFYTIEITGMCCPTLKVPVGVHEDCVANRIEAECRYEVVNKVTGEECQQEFEWQGLLG